MNLHTLAIKAKPLVPASWFRVARAVLTALLTPVWWSLNTGHWRSALKGRPVDAEGRPTAWYTYPALRFLEQVDFSGKSILEFGSGNSTLWWAARADRVTALENDAAWYGHLGAQLQPNASVHLVDFEVNARSVSLCKQLGPYNVIVIDGLDRLGFSRVCQEWLSEDGVIIVDNSEGYWSEANDRSHPIIDHFQGLGFQRVDFLGYCADGSQRASTSIFFRDNSFLFRNLPPPPMAPCHVH